MIALIITVNPTTSVTNHSQVTPRIAWHGSLAEGLAAARKTKRPILFVSAAPQCLGVPGIW